MILVGNVFYEREIADPLYARLQTLHASGTRTPIGDLNRTYLPKLSLQGVANYQITVWRAQHGAEVKHTSVWLMDRPLAQPYASD